VFRGNHRGIPFVAALGVLVVIPVTVNVSAAAAAPPTCKKNCSTADTAPPSVSIASPTSGSSVSGSITVSGTASDNVSVAKVELSLDGGAFATATGTSAWSSSLDTRNYQNGTHAVVARATDKSGNSATTSTTVSVSNVTADVTAPTVAISSPTAGATVTGAVTVAGNAADNSTVTRVEVAIDGGAYVLASGTTSWTSSWSSSAVADGTHSITSKATDGAGNTTLASVTVTSSNAAPPTPPPPARSISACSDGSAVLQQQTTPEGALIAVCTTTGGWTPSSVYNLLQPNALDLSVVGPHLTIQLQTGRPSSTGTSASCCDAEGHYYGYRATIVLNPSSTSSFSAVPDAIMAHEYGHAWTYYWFFMNPANDGSWAAYDNFRWAAANGTQVLSQHPSLNTSYTWMDYEMAGDDYRRLFGTPAAKAQLAFLNASVPDSQQVVGLTDFLLNTWR
jgi:hypothetical protein